MKDYSPECLAALESGDALVSAAVKIDAPGQEVAVFGGTGALTLGGEPYQGIGDRGLVTVTGNALGSAAQNDVLELSGVEPELMIGWDQAPVRRAPTLIWRIVANRAGSALLDARVWKRGRLDKVNDQAAPAGPAVLRGEVETAARSLGRKGGRMRTDWDQRMISPSDGGFKNVTQAGEKTLAWGGIPPARAGQTLPGSGSGFVGGLIRTAAGGGRA